MNLLNVKLLIKFNIMKNLKKFKQGFTIIELLVVISIFGMISTAATASLSLIRSRANEHKAQIDLATLSKAIELLYFDTGQYPYGLSANPCLVDEKNLFLNDKIAGLVDFDGVIFKKEKRWAGPYMNQIPNDPWKKMYKFNGGAFPLVGIDPCGPINYGDNLEWSYTNSIIMRCYMVNRLYFKEHNIRFDRDRLLQDFSVNLQVMDSGAKSMTLMYYGCYDDGPLHAQDGGVSAYRTAYAYIINKQ